MNNLYNSTDGTTRFIEDITNGGMTISKGTLCLWSNDIANKLIPETQNIEFNLYAISMETTIKDCHNEAPLFWENNSKEMSKIFSLVVFMICLHLTIVRYILSNSC